MQLRDSGLANSNLPKSSENSINNFSLSLAESEFGNPQSKVVNLLFLLHYLGLMLAIISPLGESFMLLYSFFNDPLTRLKKR